MLDNKKAYSHDFSGNCAPGRMANYSSQDTFSVGIFQWVPKASGKGLKRTAVKYRIRGPVGKAEEIYARAQDVCKYLNSGKRMNRKSETVK